MVRWVCQCILRYFVNSIIFRYLQYVPYTTNVYLLKPTLKNQKCYKYYSISWKVEQSRMPFLNQSLLHLLTACFKCLLYEMKTNSGGFKSQKSSCWLPLKYCLQDPHQWNNRRQGRDLSFFFSFAFSLFETTEICFWVYKIGNIMPLKGPTVSCWQGLFP